MSAAYIPAKCHAYRHRKLRSNAYSRLGVVKMLELLQHELSRFEKCINYLKKLEPIWEKKSPCHSSCEWSTFSEFSYSSRETHWRRRVRRNSLEYLRNVFGSLQNVFRDLQTLSEPYEKSWHSQDKNVTSMNYKKLAGMGLLKPWTIAEHSLFSIIPQTFIAQRRALQWWENEPREPKISSIAGTSRSNHSIDRWRTFRPGFRRTSIATSQHLTELLIWNAKDVSHFCSLDPLLQIAWGIFAFHWPAAW